MLARRAAVVKRGGAADSRARGAAGLPAGIDILRCSHYGYNMNIETKVRKIGNSLGIVLPREALQILKVEEGTTLYLTEAPNAALRVTAESKGFEDMMSIANRGMMKYRNALRELAK